MATILYVSLNEDLWQAGDIFYALRAETSHTVRKMGLRPAKVNTVYLQYRSAACLVVWGQARVFTPAIREWRTKGLKVPIVFVATGRGYTGGLGDNVYVHDGPILPGDLKAMVQNALS